MSGQMLYKMVVLEKSLYGLVTFSGALCTFGVKFFQRIFETTLMHLGRSLRLFFFPTEYTTGWLSFNPFEKYDIVKMA